MEYRLNNLTSFDIFGFVVPVHDSVQLRNKIRNCHSNFELLGKGI